MENEKSLLEIFQVFVKRLRTFSMIVFLFLAIGIGAGLFLNQKVYSSETTLTVGAEAERNTGEYNSISGEPITETYIKYGSNKISNEEYKFYKEIFKSTDLLKAVINNLDLEMSVNELRKSISIKVPENSNTILLTMSRPDYEQFDLVMDELVNVFKIKNYDITGLENIEVIDLASEAEENNSVDVILFAILSLFFGIITAVIVVLIQEYLDDSIQSQKEIKEMNLPLLGYIEETTFEEDLKKVRTNIEHSTQFLNKKTFVIASPSLGTKNISINLASALAQTNQKILYMDADFRDTKDDYEEVDIENEKGLSDFLIGESNLNSIIQTSKQNYQVITAGTNLKYPSEKLSSVKMKQLLSELKKQYSYIVIKGHPLNDVTDTVALSTLTGGVILQVVINQTKIKDILKIKETLSDINIDILGVILISNK